MLMYNLIEYSGDYMKISGLLWQNYRNERFIYGNGVIIDVPDDSNSASFKYKQRITGQRGNDETKGIQIMAPLAQTFVARRRGGEGGWCWW